MIATLVLLTCLVSGDDCRQTPVAVLPALQCSLLWQLPAAKFMGDNPGRVLLGYACLPGIGGA